MTLPSSLDLHSVPALLKHADALAASGTLDLSGVQQADSAGIAFLVELARRAKRQGKALRLTGAGPQIRRLTSFFELDPLLELA